MKTASIRILALDSQPLYLHGITDAFRAVHVVESVTACTTYDEFILQLKEKTPHLVFLELNLHHARHDGFSICREIKQRYKNVFVAVLSRYNAPHFVQHALECGAGAYFDKQTELADIFDFLNDFAKGKLKSPRVKVAPYTAATAGLFKPEGFELRYLLTKQECRVMKLIVGGKEHKEIEEELHISYDTYRTHHDNILSKLHVKNDVELTKFALLHHLTEMDCEQLPSYIQQEQISPK